MLFGLASKSFNKSLQALIRSVCWHVPIDTFMAQYRYAEINLSTSSTIIFDIRLFTTTSKSG